jgi:hypothetical protein
MLGLSFHCQDGSNIFTQNVGELLSDYMVSHARRSTLHSHNNENQRSNIVRFLIPLSMLRVYSVDDSINEYGAVAGMRNGRGN